MLRMWTIILLLSSSSVASARPARSDRDILTSAPIVVEARLEEVAEATLFVAPSSVHLFPTSGERGKILQFRVKKIWKGVLRERFAVYLPAPEDQPCSDPHIPKKGKDYFLLPNGEGTLTANRCSLTLFLASEQAALKFKEELVKMGLKSETSKYQSAK